MDKTSNAVLAKISCDGRNKVNGTKAQFCVNPDGKTIHVFLYYLGARHDKFIFDNSGLAVLQDILENMESPIFQQDGATIHGVNFNSELIRCFLDFIVKWPANSPDLNIIENILYFTKTRLTSLIIRLYKTHEKNNREK